MTGAASAVSEVDGLAVTPCDPHHPDRIPTISLARGVHVIRTSEGVHTGLQLDRIVLASAAGGGALAVGDGRVTAFGDSTPAAPRITMLHNGATTRMRVHVSGATNPFWLVLGESQSNGWKATIANDGDLGRSRLVDGYANGWLVHPTHASFDVVLEWTPQRRVWAALWISALGALLCLAIVAGAFVRRRVRAPSFDARERPSDARVWLEWPVPRRRESPIPARPAPWRDWIIVPAFAGLVAALVVAPWVGAVVAVLLLAIKRQPRWRVVLGLGPAVLLVLVTAYVVYLQHHLRFPQAFEWPTLFPLGRPLAWLAIVLLGVDVFVERVRARSVPPSPP